VFVVRRQQLCVVQVAVTDLFCGVSLCDDFGSRFACVGFNPVWVVGLTQPRTTS
jgi:hypothetical protein